MSNSADIITQYEACLTDACFLRRDDRGLLEVRGKDHTAWLNNLVTNVVLTLQPGEGNYAFAITVKGRTVCDLNFLVLPDRLWLDIDHRLLEKATAHFQRYIVTEDVALRDISGESGRLALIGPRAPEVVGQLGFGNVVPMASLQHTGGRAGTTDALMFRHDIAGLPGAEFIVTIDAAHDAVEALSEAIRGAGARKLTPEVVDILRIEAGIPASVEDIDEEVVPPETGQIERGISYQKGCYLGQEVIERMRSHGVLPRRLVGVRFEGDAPVRPQSRIIVEDTDVGRATSGCYSEALEGALNLAYVKTVHAEPGTRVIAQTGAGPRPGVVVQLPVRK